MAEYTLSTELFVSYQNLSAREYLELMRGPQQISHEIVIPITVVYVIIFVTGVIGNVIVCLVIARNAQFQTPTNYYLFSLAISDLLILMFGLPNDLQVYWQQYPWILGEPFCKIRALVAEMTSYASVLTIVAFSTERYLAICHPLLIQTVSSLSRAIKIIATVWAIACLCALPFAVFTKVNYLEYPNGTGMYLQESAFCSLPMDNNDVSLPLVQFSSFVFFCLPMTLIVIIYVKIGLKLRRSRFSSLDAQEETCCYCLGGKDDRERSNGSVATRGRANSSGNSGDGKGRQSSRRSINKMLVAVVIAFFLCWAPFHTQRLFVCFFDIIEWTRELRTLNEILYYTGGCLYYFSATINPILYSLISAKYREAFRDALCSFNGKRDVDFTRYSYRPSESIVAASRSSCHLENGDTTQTIPSQDIVKAKGASEDAKMVRQGLCRLLGRLGLRKQRVKADCERNSVPIIKITGSSPEKTVPPVAHFTPRWKSSEPFLNPNNAQWTQKNQKCETENKGTVFRETSV